MQKVNFKFGKVRIDFMNFIAEKSVNVENPMNVREMCREFIEFSGSSCSLESLEQRVYIDRRKIHKMENFDIETKVRMLFTLSASVDSNFLNELEKQATVDVDEKDRITSYIANDGNLKLKGDHHSSKRKSYFVERRKSKMLQKVSSHKFKGEKGELDVEDEDEDDEEENLENKINESITSSGRVSKKRSFFDFSKDADDGKHKSSTKKKTKKVSKSKPSKEVIYDGPGEPSLPFPLMIKPEAIQYQIHPEYREENKPIPFDLYNIQLQEQHIERLIGDDVEFENTQFLDNNQNDGEVKMEVEDQEVLCDTHFVPVIESTNSDDFFQLLQNIVKTLDSEMLAELERDIQTEMESFWIENRKIQIKDIEKALRATILVVIKAAKPKGASSENSKSLIGFLMLLNMIALSNSALTVIQKQIQGAIRELEDEDKTVSIKNIRTILETMLLMVTS